MKDGVIDFPEDAYKSPFCHECREDEERCKRAMEHDSQQTVTVQEVNCKACGKRLNWWWYAKLPLTQEEKDKVQLELGGNIWKGKPK